MIPVLTCRSATSASEMRCCLACSFAALAAWANARKAGVGAFRVLLLPSTWLTQPNLESAGQLEAGRVGLLPLQRSLLIQRQGGRTPGSLRANKTGYRIIRGSAL